MELWQAIFLGAVQGLAEFLPISSSAHLLLLQDAMHVSLRHNDEIVFDVALHAGTLVALFAYFREDLLGIVTAWGSSIVRRRRVPTDLQRVNARAGWLILLGTCPAIIAYKLFEAPIMRMESRPTWIAGMLIAFSLIFIIAERFKGTKQFEDVGVAQALLIGLGQALALFPGTSRSGATISTGMLLGLDRAAAARFSFLLSAPVVLAAIVLKIPDLVHAGVRDGGFLVLVAVGFIASAISGYIAVTVLLRFVRGHSLAWFAAYRVPVGIIALLWFST